MAAAAHGRNLPADVPAIAAAVMNRVAWGRAGPDPNGVFVGPRSAL